MTARAAFAAVLPLLASVAVAQQPTAKPPSLHDAWLREVLDLDVPAARRGYEEVAANATPGNLERWIAVARLVELQRLQAITTLPPQLAEAPPPVRAAVQALPAPTPVEPLLQRARRAPTEGLQVLTAEGQKMPALRPLVPAAEDWMMGQIGPSLRDRMRQRAQTFANRTRSADARRFTERLYALDLVRAEVQGRTAQAVALRTLYFADWHAPNTAGDPTVHLARVRTNLEAWLADKDLGNQQATVLRELRDAIEKAAATDPAAALALVARLPLYAERLLDAAGASRPDAARPDPAKPDPGRR